MSGCLNDSAGMRRTTCVLCSFSSLIRLRARLVQVEVETWRHKADDFAEPLHFGAQWLGQGDGKLRTGVGSQSTGGVGAEHLCAKKNGNRLIRVEVQDFRRA